MRLLVDTHVAIWTVTNDERLSQRARDLLAGPDNITFVSAASIWEIAIKHRLARDPADMPISGHEAIGWFEAAGYELLPVTPAHAAAIDQLGVLRSDPFDLLLLAQAVTEPMQLVTHDSRLASLGPGVIRV